MEFALINLGRKRPIPQEPKMSELKSVLIVDDELSVRESLKMILKPICRVHTAADGREALECLQKNKIDLVTLDLRMPGLSGLDVLRQIKRRDPDIEVMIITAFGSSEDNQDATRHGARGILSKPFSVSELMAAVNELLEKRKSNLRLRNLSLYNSLVVRN
jgi:two-component system response regulator HydG